MLTPRQVNVLEHRAIEILREVAVLIIAFAPLDAVGWAENAHRWATMLTFLLGGALLLGVAFAWEVRSARD